MKKHILLFTTLTLLASACQNQLDLGFEHDPECLVMNALLNTNDENHSVYMSLSRFEGTLEVEDAQLRCYINGTAVAEAEYVAPSYKPSYYSLTNSQYRFTARIRPGDEVRLEATRGSLRASATVVVPQAAAITAVDTTFVEKSPYFTNREDGEGALACRLKLQDIPGQSNCYRLVTYYDYSNRFYDYTYREKIGFGYLQDPILKDRFVPEQKKGNDLAALFFMSRPNSYCTFRDGDFADGTAEVEIHIPEQYYNAPAEPAPDNRITRKFEYVLLSITQDEYDYLGQVDKSLNASSHLGRLEEPIRIPTNVEGGLGFVSVASAATLSLTYDD